MCERRLQNMKAADRGAKFAVQVIQLVHRQNQRQMRPRRTYFENGVQILLTAHAHIGNHRRDRKGRVAKMQKSLGQGPYREHAVSVTLQALNQRLMSLRTLANQEN